MQQLQNFIDGQFVDPQNGKFVPSFNPATGEPFLQVPDSDAEDIDAAVEAAKKVRAVAPPLLSLCLCFHPLLGFADKPRTQAFPAWSRTSAEQRAKIINKIADLIEENLEEFAEAESKDNGKTVALARTMDIPRAVANFRFFASAILHHEESSTTIEGAINYTIRSPIGVAGLISPWFASTPPLQGLCPFILTHLETDRLSGTSPSTSSRGRWHPPSPSATRSWPSPRR
jgi:aminomuconate-semialdehyde/2-hydroxymuconate-6-semialdehyde dehydrogenase